MDDDKSCFRIQVILQIENALFFPNSYKISSTVWVKIDIFFPYWKRINPFFAVCTYIDFTEKTSLTLCQPGSQFRKKGSALKRKLYTCKLKSR